MSSERTRFTPALSILTANWVGALSATRRSIGSLRLQPLTSHLIFVFTSCAVDEGRENAQQSDSMSGGNSSTHPSSVVNTQTSAGSSATNVVTSGSRPEDSSAQASPSSSSDIHSDDVTGSTSTTTTDTGAPATDADVTNESAVTTALVSTAQASSTDGNDSSQFEGKELFILFGQSNMSGFAPMPEETWVLDENITFMVQYDCARLGQTKDQWLPAQPPLHGCQWATNGLGLGLGDYFGKTMAASWPGSKIGLIPNAIPAVTIDIFMKGGPAPEGASKALPDGYTSAYTLMVDRATQAQKEGRIRGILLNQGESDFNQGFGDEWPQKVATLVADLRADLGLGEGVPFIAGEVPPTGNYSGHNKNVHELTNLIPNCAVVSGEGTQVHDGIHYDQAGVEIMGERYAAMLLELSNGDASDNP